MTPQSQSELQGNFLTHPFAELLAEISHAELTGSLRLSNGERKCVVYFRSGRVVFAVSNARTSRLFDILLRRNRLQKEDLGKIPNFENDIELANKLEEKGLITKADRNQLFKDQIKGILIDALSWEQGDWAFSHLTRLRDGLVFDVESERLLIDYARCLSTDTVCSRFRTMQESFTRSSRPVADFTLNHDEITVLAKFSTNTYMTDELLGFTQRPEATTLRALYTLWLCGLLVRSVWNPAFSEIKISAIRNVKLELKQDARSLTPKEPEETPAAAPADAGPEQPAEVAITLEDYLKRVAKAGTHYDILGVKSNAAFAEIKRAYFTFAKTFHPDHYHKDGGELLQRVQNAFTELTHAYETLKNADSRETYDFKVRKELADREKHEAAGTTDQGGRQMQQAAESFERGYSLLMDNESEAAAAFLARAAHFDPMNARYHAYYGKALAADPDKRHKAESEMQTGIRLDPQNASLRIMLAEFFIQVNLKKRAEGELTRMLAMFPNNRDAQALLATLQS